MRGKTKNPSIIEIKGELKLWGVTLPGNADTDFPFLPLVPNTKGVNEPTSTSNPRLIRDDLIVDLGKELNECFPFSPCDAPS